MRVLVTGGCGFVGSHVVEAMLSARHQVRVLDDLSAPPHAPPPDPSVEFVLGSVTDHDVVRRALADVDVVCHQAAKVGVGKGSSDLADYAVTNVVGTAVLLAGMEQTNVRRLVLASSMVVYGEGGYECDTDGQVRPDARTRVDMAAGRFEPLCPDCGEPLRVRQLTESVVLEPRTGYAATKLAQEHLAAAWAVQGGGSVVALRYHNVYGPRMPRDTPYAGVASLFRSALLQGEAPRVFEDGQQLRDFIHVRDVARANVLALDATAEPSAAEFTPFNVATGRPATVFAMASSLAAALRGAAPVVTGEFRLGDARHVLASPEAIKEELGFSAGIVLEEGMAEFARELSP